MLRALATDLSLGRRIQRHSVSKKSNTDDFCNEIWKAKERGFRIAEAFVGYSNQRMLATLRNFDCRNHSTWRHRLYSNDTIATFCRLLKGPTARSLLSAEQTPITRWMDRPSEAEGENFTSMKRFARVQCGACRPSTGRMSHLDIVPSANSLPFRTHGGPRRCQQMCTVQPAARSWSS